MSRNNSETSTPEITDHFERCSDGRLQRFALVSCVPLAAERSRGCLDDIEQKRKAQNHADTDHSGPYNVENKRLIETRLGYRLPKGPARSSLSNHYPRDILSTHRPMSVLDSFGVFGAKVTLLSQAIAMVRVTLRLIYKYGISRRIHILLLENVPITNQNRG